MVVDPSFGGLWRIRGAIAGACTGIALAKVATQRLEDPLNKRFYAKTSDQAANRRMEILEWVIIILIALSIGMELFH
jgi:hypothetical protein